MWRWRSVAAPLFATVAALTLGACGDGGPDLRPCTPPKTGSGEPNCSCPSGTLEPDCRVDCTTTNVLQDSGGIPARTFLYDDFSVPDSGRLDVTLDWTVASSPMGVYIVPANTCGTVEEFNARSCNFLVRSEPSTTKPRKISTANFAAGNYRWIVANFSTEQESASLQIVLQKGTGCAPMAGGPPSAAAAREGDLPPLERVEHR